MPETQTVNQDQTQTDSRENANDNQSEGQQLLRCGLKFYPVDESAE